MRFKTEEREWQFVKESEIWNLTEENHILPALRLSYHHLPSHLKQCFAYCSILPKDYFVERESLIKDWMAHGFIEQIAGGKPMEDIGEEYFNNLRWRSFFELVHEHKYSSNIVYFKMHDLMHDLAHSVWGAECSIVTAADSTVSIPDGCRHLSVVRRRSLKATSKMVLNGAKNLRTLALIDRGITLPSHHNISTYLLCLRVLRLNDVHFTTSILKSISELKQLRLLDLSRGDMQLLPDSITNLHNLQTLVHEDCASLEKLPGGMRRMSNLRHLCIGGCDSLTHVPAKIGELKFLRTLPTFIVDEEDSGCSIRELQDLMLGGYLNIKKLENVRGVGNAREAKLSVKANLTDLCLSWSHGLNPNELSEQTQTLEGLQPHPNLKTLQLESYAGERVPRWLSCCFLLPNLVEMWLTNCRMLEQLPSLGHLRLLKYLEITGAPAVKCIGSDFYGDLGFPSLERLFLIDMPNLEEWSGGSNGRQVLARLNNLGVCGCPKLTAIPNFPSLSLLKIENFKEAESLPVGFFHNQTHVSVLIIRGCTKLKSLPRELGNLAALEELQILNCGNLVTEELKGHPYLKRLCIEDCHALTSLRLQGLASLFLVAIKRCENLVTMVGGMQDLFALRCLIIDGCGDVVSWLEGVESLEEVHIMNCDKEMCLPEGLKHASVLQRLILNNLSGLAALPEWIGNLSSLQHLKIECCCKVVSLPYGLQNVTSLKYLDITRCPELEKRCKKEMGEDWYKIAHVPYIQIGEM